MSDLLSFAFMDADIPTQGGRGTLECKLQYNRKFYNTYCLLSYPFRTLGLTSVNNEHFLVFVNNLEFTVVIREIRISLCQTNKSLPEKQNWQTTLHPLQRSYHSPIERLANINIYCFDIIELLRFLNRNAKFEIDFDNLNT